MIIEQKDLRRVQTILLAILSGMWILFCSAVWRSGSKGGFDAAFILISTAVAAAVVLFVLLRTWEGEVVSPSLQIQHLDNPNHVSDRVEVHFAKVRLVSGRLKRVRLGSNKEVLKRLNLKEGDRLIKKRWALFCVGEKA